MKTKTLVLIVMIIISAISMFGCTLSGVRYHPTVEAAFADHSGGSRNFGEVLFIDEQDNSLTIFHKGRGLYISHYLRDVREDGDWYLCVGVATGGPLIEAGGTSHETSQFLIYHWHSSSEVLYERIGRRPLYGVSYDPIIHTLSINGIPVDYVIETTNIHGDPLFLWYFSDFPLLEGSQEDIIISFDEYE